MKKLAPVIAVIVTAGAMAVLVYFATKSTPPVDPPANGGYVPKNIEFKIEDFMVKFDLDTNGLVTFDEFSQVYGQGDPPLVFTAKDGDPPLSAEKAFRQWDRDSSGYVNAEDMTLLTDAAKLAEAERLAALGLHSTAWNDLNLALNEHQFRTFNAETGAAARGELPFAGTFWAAHHFKGRWSRISDPKEGEVYGYATERDGRVFVLTSKAELLVKIPAKVEVSQLPADDPHMLYAAEIAKTPFDNPDKNLELARKCKEWGMAVESGMLFARVLLFKPDNQESLDALGYKLEGNKFVAKGE